MYTRTFDSSNHENQSVMAMILQNLPKESSITKIEYEGPRIALYTNKPKFLIENNQILSNIVNLIKKRIVLRLDESIRLSENEVISIVKKLIPKQIELSDILFDPALGEATVFVKKMSPLLNEDKLLNELILNTGWKMTIRRTPKTISTLKAVNKIIKNSSEYRIKFYKRIGEKIFRDKMDSNIESSLISLGGFGEIGRSSMILCTNESNILIDCGLNLYTTDPLSRFPRFDSIGIKPSDIDASVLTHAHFDHSGFLPALFKYGYNGPIYCTEPTAYLMYILFKQYISDYKEEVYYTERELEQVFSHLIHLNYNIVTDLTPDIKVTMYNSGHVLGSASLHFHIGNGDHNFVYTGDLKFGKSSYLENAVWNFPRSETLLIEATNGGREDTFPSREDAVEKLVKNINETIRSNNFVLIPTQLIGTTQELIVTLDLLIKSKGIEKCKIYINKLINEINSVHEYNTEFLNKDVQQNILTGSHNPFRSKILTNKIDINSRDLEPGIILFPSSMLHCIHSTPYLKKIISNENNLIIFISKQVAFSMGKDISEGKKNILLDNEYHEVKCKIEHIYSLNSHSDFNQLNAYISRLRPKLKRIVVNHGERAKVQNLSGYINKVHNIPSQYILNQEAIKLL